MQPQKWNPRPKQNLLFPIQQSLRIAALSYGGLQSTHYDKLGKTEDSNYLLVPTVLFYFEKTKSEIPY